MEDEKKVGGRRGKKRRMLSFIPFDEGADETFLYIHPSIHSFIKETIALDPKHTSPAAPTHHADR